METIWQRLSWPQVVAFSVMVVGALVAVIFVPTETWARLPWEAIAGIVAMLVSGGASAFLDRAVRPRTSAPPPLPRDRKNGSVDIEALRWVIAWALALGAAIWTGIRSGVFVLGSLALIGVAGCGSASVVKPALVTACGVARVACGVVESACGIVDGALASASPAPSSGGETTVDVTPP